MLKGHSVIELTDVNTGEVERYEDDNIVTNGLQYYSRYHSIPADTWKNLLSGIRLFDSQLEENVETLFAPLTVETVGYASLDADTVDPRRGLFNLAESGRFEDLSGVKLVWDFAQSQGNGTISCVGITPNEYLVPDSVNSSSSPNIEYREVSRPNNYNGAGSIIDYDFKRGIETAYLSRKSKNTIVIRKIYARFYYHSIINESPGYVLLNEVNVDIPGEFSSCTTEARFLGSDVTFYYFITLKGNNTSVKPYVSNFMLIRIDKVTLNVQVEEFSFSEEAYENVYFSSISDQLNCSFLMNGYIYLGNKFSTQSDSRSGLYKFKLSDLSFVKALLNNEKVSSIIYGGDNFLVRGDGVLFDGISMDLEDNFHEDRWLFGKKTTGVDLYIPVENGLYTLKSYSSSFAIYESSMLFTVNNLSSPVTKTADKTMKITYILKEVYPETAP